MLEKKYTYSYIHFTIGSFFNFLLQFFFRNGAFVYVIIVAFLSAVTFIILILNATRLEQWHLSYENSLLLILMYKI